MRILSAIVAFGACGISQEEHQAALDRVRRQLNEDCQVQVSAYDKRVTALNERLGRAESEKRALSDKLGAGEREIEELRKAREAAERRSKTYRDLMAKLRSMIDAGQLQVEVRKGKMIVKMSDRILFDPGKTDLKPEGQEALTQLAGVLRDIPDRDFLVAGHTDNVPIKSARFKSNWELSTGRAVEVVKFLQGQAVNPARLGASGYSEFDAVGDNGNDSGRALNRRIEVVLMPNIEELPQISE